MALIDLTAVREEARLDSGNTADDTGGANLTQIAADVSDWIDQELGRTLASATYTKERAKGNGRAFMLTRQWPVTSITDIFFDPTWAFAASSALTSTDYAIGREATGIFHKGSFAKTTREDYAITYVAGYTTYPADLKRLATKLAVQIYLRLSGQTHIETSRVTGGSDSESFVRSFITKEDQKILNRHSANWGVS